MGKKKKKRPETGMERLKAMPLWQWGLITIFAGLIANMLSGSFGPTGNSAAARGAAAGRAVASAFFILVGLGLIIADVVRRNRQ